MLRRSATQTSAAWFSCAMARPPGTSHARLQGRCRVGAAVAHENRWSDERGFHPDDSPGVTLSPEAALRWSDDPRLWRPFGR